MPCLLLSVDVLDSKDRESFIVSHVTTVQFYHKCLALFTYCSIFVSSGVLTLNLVREFLDFFHLDFTRSVFEPEVGVVSVCVVEAWLVQKGGSVLKPNLHYLRMKVWFWVPTVMTLGIFLNVITVGPRSNNLQ